MKNETSIKVPKKYQGMIRVIYKDIDGYWAETEDGFFFPENESHIAHEDTQAALLAEIRNIEPCTCSECKKAAEKTVVEDPKEVLKLTGQPLTPELNKCHYEAKEKAKKKPAKLSKTMQKAYDKMVAANWYYMHNGETCQYFATENGVRHIGFEGAGIVEGGYVYSRMDSKTLAALANRGLIEVYHDGKENLDVVKVNGMVLPDRLTKALKVKVTRWWTDKPHYGQQEFTAYAVNEEAVQHLVDHVTFNTSVGAAEVIGEVELSVWDYFKNE